MRAVVRREIGAHPGENAAERFPRRNRRIAPSLRPGEKLRLSWPCKACDGGGAHGRLHDVHARRFFDNDLPPRPQAGHQWHIIEHVMVSTHDDHRRHVG